MVPFVTALLALSLSALSAPPPAEPPGASPARASAARSPAQKLADEIHRIMSNLKSTKYNHAIIVDETKGNYEVDCSGLACYALKRVLPLHYKRIRHGKSKRPRAVHFYEAFAAAPTDPAGRNGWRQIERVVDSRPGDILVWKAAPGEKDPDGHVTTGHVVFIDSLPEQTSPTQVRVTIIDSSHSGHANDTRDKGQSGIGRGTMWFEVDAKGRPIGYRWCSPKGKLNERATSIGRPVLIR